MAERIVHEKLGKILVGQGLITEDQLEMALQAQTRIPNKRIGNFLFELGIVTETEVTRALGIQFNMPVISLSEITVSPEVLRYVPKEFAKRSKVFPVFLVENELTLAMDDPTSFGVMDALAGINKCRVQGILATTTDIETAIATNYAALDAGGDKGKIRIKTDETDQINASDIEQLAKAGEEVPIINLVNRLITQALKEGASDIHIEPFEDRLLVRYRIDGVLKETSSLEMRIHRAVLSRIKILASLNIAERFSPQDGRVQMSLGQHDLDIRVSTLPMVHGEKAVMRLLDRRNVQILLPDLGFSPSNIEAFQGLINQPYGIVLVTGPTGSGKTTTLYAALNVIKGIETNIVTVEDPVEYQLPLINQVQINPRRDLTFANALRSILRQDPDVVMIGEIRDPETAMIATQAALTGHLVLATLHTNDAPGAIARLVDMGVDPYLLAPALLGVVAQRLVRRVCEKCKEFYMPGQTELEKLGFPDIGDVQFSRGKGCSHCNKMRYKGRTGIHEVLVVNEPIRHMIAVRSSTSEIKAHAVNDGFTDMRFDGLRKIISGETTTEEILTGTKS